MIFFSKDAEESFDKLLYYPYTIGKHLQKTISDVNNIMSALSSLPIVAPGVMTRRVIPNIGTITYLSTPTSYFIQYISWSTILTRFYYVKSNFITFNSQGNITSVHPALYADRNEPSFECDNGFKVVSRFVTVRGKRTEVFNFKDLSGHIICDIDFTQVKPFDEYKDMTARGYTPNRRCYMVFEDGYKEEVNESRNTRLESIINECVDRCLRKYLNEEKIALNESKSRQEKEQMLIDLYNYLSKEPTDDIYDGGQYGKGHLNIKYKAYNYFEPKGIVHNVWAIHYTNLEGYEGIQSRGFRIGVSDYDALAYSQGYYNYEPPRKSGWNFALPIDNKYLGDDLGYGDCGFIIKTDGVRAYHKGDKDDEIIFKGCMVKKKYPFVYDEDYNCWILSGFGYNYKGEELPNGAYFDEVLEQVVFEDVYSLIQYVVS